MLAELADVLLRTAPRNLDAGLPRPTGSGRRRRGSASAWSSTRSPASPTSRPSPGTSGSSAERGGLALGGLRPVVQPQQAVHDHRALTVALVELLLQAPVVPRDVEEHESIALA